MVGPWWIVAFSTVSSMNELTAAENLCFIQCFCISTVAVCDEKGEVFIKQFCE